MPSQFKFLPFIFFCFFANASTVGIFQQEQLDRRPLSTVRREGKAKPAYIWHLIDEISQGDVDQALIDMTEIIAVSIASPILAIKQRARGDGPSTYVSNLFVQREKSNKKTIATNDNVGPFLYYNLTDLRDKELIDALIRRLSPDFPKIADVLCLISPDDKEQRYLLGEYLIKNETHYNLFDLEDGVVFRFRNPPLDLVDKSIQERSNRLRSEVHTEKGASIVQYLRGILIAQLDSSPTTAKKMERLANLIEIYNDKVDSVDSSLLRRLVNVLYLQAPKPSSFNTKISLQILRKKTAELIKKAETSGTNFRSIFNTPIEIWNNVDDSIFDFKQNLLNSIIATNEAIQKSVIDHLSLDQIDVVALKALDSAAGIYIDKPLQTKILDNPKALSTFIIYAPNLSLQLYTTKNISKKLSQALRLNRKRLMAMTDELGERSPLDFEDQLNFNQLVEQLAQPKDDEDYALFSHLLSFAQDYRIHDPKLLSLAFRQLRILPQDSLAEIHKQVLFQVMKYIGWSYINIPFNGLEAQILLDRRAPNFDYRFYLSRPLVQHSANLQLQYIDLLYDNLYVIRAYLGLSTSQLKKSNVRRLFTNWKSDSKQLYLFLQTLKPSPLELFGSSEICSSYLNNEL